MFDINAAISSFLFRIDQLQPADYLDIFLVTILFYLLFMLIRRSQAAFFMRGLIALALILLTANLLLPLPTFGLILSVSMLVILITVPITLQPELRRWVEQFGRRFGFTIDRREDVAEQVVSPVARTAENLASSRTGALIVLEGNIPLDEIIASGVPVNGQVTSELLQTIFFDKTPLHDGAVAIRGSHVVAAGCVLPLTERELRGRYRLGTRHRAALGMSEQSDALTVVVSEETGTISIAQDGHLERGLDRTGLHQRLTEFYTKTERTQPISKWRPWKGWHFRMPTMRRLLANLAYLLVSFVLAVAASTAVRQQNNPFITTTMTAVPLIVENLEPDKDFVSPPPQTVSVDFQTTAAELSGLGPNSFQASINLSGAVEGTSRVPVEVRTAADKVLLLGPKPSEVDVTLASVLSRAIPVTVQIENRNQLSPAYEVQGQKVVPEDVIATGARPDLDRIAEIRAAVSVAGATSIVQQRRPLVALDEDGNEVEEVDLEPDEVDVSVTVRRRIDARDVGVRAVTSGSPPDEYWLSGLSVNPSTVTIQGNPSTIADIGGFVDTVPVDLTDAVGIKQVQVPLDLPADVQALDNSGNALGTVTVNAVVEPLSGDLLVERPVQLINDRGTLTITLEPPQVTLLLSGPLSTLNEIESNPELVQVVIDTLQLNPGESVEVIPEIIAPIGVRTQVVEGSVLVTVEP